MIEVHRCSAVIAVSLMQALGRVQCRLHCLQGRYLRLIQIEPAGIHNITCNSTVLVDTHSSNLNSGLIAAIIIVHRNLLYLKPNENTL